jgi:hypothetical protein
MNHLCGVGATVVEHAACTSKRCSVLRGQETQNTVQGHHFPLRCSSNGKCHTDLKSTGLETWSPTTKWSVGRSMHKSRNIDSFLTRVEEHLRHCSSSGWACRHAMHVGHACFYAHVKSNGENSINKELCLLLKDHAKRGIVCKEDLPQEHVMRVSCDTRKMVSFAFHDHANHEKELWTGWSW